MKKSKLKKLNLQGTNDREEGIVLPMVMWWLGVPLSLLLILWAVGVF